MRVWYIVANYEGGCGHHHKTIDTALKCWRRYYMPHRSAGPSSIWRLTSEKLSMFSNMRGGKL